MNPLFKAKNLVVSVENQIILKGLNLTINPGEIHVIMGPNGSGKTTFSNVIARHSDYIIQDGIIELNGYNIVDVAPEICARNGLFVSFQYPIAIPGVSNISFLKASVNAIRKAQDKLTYDAMEFLQIVKDKMAKLQINENFLYRSINEGFSGGEKKRNEILQMMLLKPKLAILDEVDSGLDVDALKNIAVGINECFSKDRAILLITHYRRLLDYVVPDKVHIMIDGKIVYTGDKSLPDQIEKKGYSFIKGTTV